MKKRNRWRVRKVKKESKIGTHRQNKDSSIRIFVIINFFYFHFDFFLSTKFHLMFYVLLTE